MPKFNVHFELTEFAEDNSGIRIATDYSFWVPLIRYFLDEASEFEIHCREDERAAVKEILAEVKDAACSMQKRRECPYCQGHPKRRSKEFHPVPSVGRKREFKMVLCLPQSEWKRTVFIRTLRNRICRIRFEPTATGFFRRCPSCRNQCR